MKALIFGVNGQDGFYLSLECASHRIVPIGISRSAGDWIQGDVSDYAFVERLIKEHKPNFVFHLAAVSTTSHEAIFENHKAISTGTINILEAIKRHQPACKVFVTGSGTQFRNAGKQISETAEFEASSPYSVSRIESVYATRYFRTLGIKAYVGYLFHHESALRKKSHLSRIIVEGVKKIAQGELKFIEIGNVEVAKEWGFARDIAKGILTLVQQDEVFEACIGTGTSHSVAEWLEKCFSIEGLDWREHVKIRRGFKPEYMKLVSDPSLINSLGWRHATNIDELARIVYKNEV